MEFPFVFSTSLSAAIDQMFSLLPQTSSFADDGINRNLLPWFLARRGGSDGRRAFPTHADQRASSQTHQPHIRNSGPWLRGFRPRLELIPAHPYSEVFLAKR